MTPTILFFTCATRFYKNFVTPYMFFAKKHNPGAKFEFILDDVDDFLVKNERSLQWLEKTYGIRPTLRNVAEIETRPKMENSFRFVMEPQTSADYVYIGDVDIMILEDVYAWHKPIFDAGLPYSNMIRDGQEKLTGLHFVRTDLYYPLGDIKDLIESIRIDEDLLFAIVKRKGLLYGNDEYRKIRPNRPIHGVHMSLNRLPFSYGKERVSWGLRYEWLEQVLAISRTDEFESFYATLYPGASQIMLNLIFLANGALSLGRDYWKARVIP